MNARVSIAVVVLGLTLAIPVCASDVGYIYGRVSTVDGETYEGQLRWGTEESFWDDIFNANKSENENIEYVDDKVRRRLSRRHFGDFREFFGIRDHDFGRLFAIRFGDMKRIHVRRGDDLVVEFRNGDELKLHGGSNDVGAEITVVDAKQGTHELKWNRIRTIEFKDTPAKLSRKLGEPLFGAVKFGKYRFTGRIQWDNDETLTTDKLDGDTRDGDTSIEFRDIASIHKSGRGARVVLKSGSELHLTGSNDVNHGNRGVVVVVKGIGSVKVGWRDFEEVTFAPAPGTGPAYSEFALGRDLTGEVVTRDGRYDGRIVFDLDESRDFEMLHGTHGDTEYLIPFRDIESIKPQGMFRSVVVLRRGIDIELEDSQDVTRKNDGLLIFNDGPKPKYVYWRDVTDVRFASATPR